MSRAKRDPVELRRQAEERLARSRLPPRRDKDDAHRLVHELRVHQIELELQNEELRASRVELEAALSSYTQLFDYAPVGYFVVLGDGTIRKVNIAGARLLGLDRSLLVGTQLGRHIAAKDQDLFHHLLAATLAMRQKDAAGESCEVTLRHEGAEPCYVRVTASELSTGNTGEVTALLAVEDMTASRRAEQAMREESRHKDEFLAALSHELRNPLGPLQNGLYLLEHTPAGSERARHALAVMDRQLAHLTHIVEDLLDVTRIARGKVHLARRPVELGELVRRTLDDHRAAFDVRGIALEARQAAEPCWVDGDPTRLVQVLGNLLGNAEKFTGRGGRVEVALRDEGAWVALAVKDTGVGIEPEVRGRLFEPFSQGPQALDRTGGGLGLGLAMVKGLIEMHGGSVDISSEGKGHGAEFTVRLPLIAAPRVSSPVAAPRRERHHRVLIIEDSEDAATSLKEVLELSGHDVQIALDGPTGLALAHEQRPEVVICDIGLSGIDGYQVARALRMDRAVRGAYLIALTGYARPDDARRAAKAGFDRHLGKPPPIERLEEMLAEAPVLDAGA